MAARLCTWPMFANDAGMERSQPRIWKIIYTAVSACSSWRPRNAVRRPHGSRPVPAARASGLTRVVPLPQDEAGPSVSARPVSAFLHATRGRNRGRHTLHGAASSCNINVRVTPQLLKTLGSRPVQASACDGLASRDTQARKRELRDCGYLRAAFSSNFVNAIVERRLLIVHSPILGAVPAATAPTCSSPAIESTVSFTPHHGTVPPALTPRAKGHRPLQAHHATACD
jgi:hypothetical protein